jgi:hypothetical protein
MKTHKLAGKVLNLVLAGVVLVSLAVVSGSTSAGPLAQGPTVVQGMTDMAPVLHYQGRLLDPATGNPKPNGIYSMTFRIYNTEVGGGPLWSETKSVAVNNGLFSVLLGDTVALDPAIFNGQALWLGVTVGSDPEAIPRQRIAHSPYALHSQHASQASELGGFPPDAFARAVHEHSGADITSGTVAASRIDPTIARDDEIMPIVLGNDGPGSGLDADTLDGYHASGFASASLLGSSSAFEANSTQDALLTMSTTGWVVRDDGDTDMDHTLVIATTSLLVEYTLWYGGTVVHGEALSGTPATITFPHYQGFQLILARHQYIASLVCNENDARVACVYQKSHP